VSRPVGWLLVAVGVVVTTAAFGGMLDAIAASVHGQSRSGAASFVWFLVGLAAALAGRYAIEEGSR
jgi:hypothetical protein